MEKDSTYKEYKRSLIENNKNERVFNEDTRVKIPATIQFMRLGYEYQSLKPSVDPTLCLDFNTRIFKNRFSKAIKCINKREFSDNEIDELISQLNSLINNNDLGKSFYNRLTSSEDPIKLIDFENINNNDFAIVDELPFSTEESAKGRAFRPDINILINGIPLAFLEVKKPNNDGGIQVEFDRMINKRLKNNEYKKFFNMIQIVSFSNNMEYEEADDQIADEIKAGSFYTTPNGEMTSFSFFREDEKDYYSSYKYKDIDETIIRNVIIDCGYNSNVVDTPEFQTNLSTDTPCNRFITSLYDKERFMFFLRYGIMFLTEIKKKENKTTNVSEEIPIKQKHIMRYPQFFAIRAIIKRLGEENKNGIIWHTQGSGKTALSAFAIRPIKDFFAKKEINARFFFIVDRLDLMLQASTEFSNREFYVENASSKKEFAKQLVKPLDSNNDGIGNICVVNIQKLMEQSSLPKAENVYNVAVQRIFFIDEAHRSYNAYGEFYKNLMTCDDNGIYIAMTGTPLLTKKERSNLKFGDYIHKYFYDKSIADGYTLRIKKEQIDTTAKVEIRENLEIEAQDLEKKDVYESNDYINGVSQYIEKDFKNFRFVNTDDTIGGMIVCKSNEQASKIHLWFEKNSKLTTGLVLSDGENPNQNKINKENQINFRENGFPDILVVHYMLTTGYDVKRLKKMYLLRGPKAQSLLQTISRVNRPYKNPQGKVYQYGYIVDFVDIEKEYNETLDAYIKELESDLNIDSDDDVKLTGLIVDKDDIKKKFDSVVAELKKFITQDNAEAFGDKLRYFNKDALYKINHLLKEVKECNIQFKLSRAEEYLSLIDEEKLKKYIKVVENRISFLNLQERPIEMLDIMNNSEVVSIIYEFIKTNVSVIDLSKFAQTDKGRELLDTVAKLQKEVQRNINKNDIKVQQLGEMLKNIFSEMNIVSFDEFNDELKEIYEETKRINDENERVSKEFGGNYAFVKTLSDMLVETKIDRSILENMLKIIYEKSINEIDRDELSVLGCNGFINKIKHDVTPYLLREKLYSKINDNYNEILQTLFFNLNLFKGNI